MSGNEKRVAVLCCLLGTLAGCGTAALTTRDLPLGGRRLAAINRQLRAKGAEEQLGWLELLYGSRDRAMRSFGRALAARPGDPTALLGRALILGERGEEQEERRAWYALLRACHRRQCTELRLVALSRLSVLTKDAAPREVLSQLTPLTKRPLDARVRDEVLTLIAKALRREGRAAEMGRQILRRGCPPRWTVAGPFHRHPHVDLERPIPRGAATRELPTRGCRLELRTEKKWGGIYQLTADVTATRSTPALLTVHASGSPWRVLIDGRPLWSSNPFGRRAASRTSLRLAWPGGRHRVSLMVGSGTGYGNVTVTLMPARPGQDRLLRWTRASSSVPPPRTPPPVTPVGCAVSASALMHQLGWPVWFAPVARYLSATLAAQCGDWDRAYGELARSQAWAPKFVAPRLMHAEVLAQDPLVPTSVASGLSHRILSGLVREAPDLGRAQFMLASLLLEEEKVDEALDLLRLGARRWPREYRWQIGFHRAFRERSYSAEEEAALERALELSPDSCSVVEDLISVKRSRWDVEGTARLIPRARRCDAASAARAQQLKEASRRREALAEIRRLLTLRPEAVHLRRDEAHLLQLLGDLRGARRVLSGIIAEYPGAISDRIRLADLRAAAGERKIAIDQLRRAFERSPWQEDLRRALERLTGRSTMERFRVDGQAAIERFKRRGGRYDAPAVVVQDRTVTRFFASGARASLTHNIVQVLSKEGIERWGEVALPRRASVLGLRTIKQDGTLCEADEIVGKRTISVPDLEVGDFVEIEYLDLTPPPSAFVGALGRRFFFRSFDVPMISSEYVVVAPRELDLQLDVIGPAPPVRRSRSGQSTILRWLARDQPRVVPEPGATPADEYIPSVRVAAGSSWGGWRDHLLDRTYDAFRTTHQMIALARRITADARSDREKARALYRWVVKQVDPSGSTLQSAARTLARGVGSRASALTALLLASGLEAELWLVRPRSASRAGSSVPQIDGFTDPLIRCRLAGGMVYLFPHHRSIPFGYVPPALRGGLALRLAPGRVMTRVPDKIAGSEEHREVRLEVTVEPDGKALVKAVDRVRGLEAQEWRRALGRVDRTRLRRLFEQEFLGLHFSGASLRRLKISDRHRVTRPLELRYDFVASDLCRRERGSLRCRATAFSPRLRQRYLRLVRRRHPLQLGFHPPTTIRLKLVPPPGQRVADLPRPVRARGKFGSLLASARRTKGGGIETTTALRIAYSRVSPAAYPRLSRFATEVDEHFEREVTIVAASAPRGR